MYEIYLYQNMVCPHESDMIRALADRSDVRITWVVDEEVLKFRSEMGIRRPDCGVATVIVTTDEDQIRRIVLDSDPQAIHIVQGPRGGVCSRVAWRTALGARRRVGLYSEPGDSRGIKGALRRLLYKYEFFKWGRQIQFVLATGQLGVDWYVNAAYPKDRVFQFCYVTKSIRETDTVLPCEHVGFRLGYCGQLIRRKNVDILLRSLARIKEQSWSCSIVGDGELAASLHQLSSSLGLEGRVHWVGTIPNSEMQRFMKQQDLLVLPSAFDGWGAVVNEALTVGTPVICSEACGAAEFLRESWRGCTVPTGSVARLAEALTMRVSEGVIVTQQRERIQSWARETIAGEPVADYLVDLMQHIYMAGAKPMAPWRGLLRGSSSVKG